MDWEAAGFTLTEEQRVAAEAPVEGLCVVEAGAGCGKTHLVTARFVYLVLEKGIEPETILCLTFSEHAAGEMRRRIKQALQRLGTLPRSICASTFHSFCEGVLRESGAAVGVSADFVVLDEGEVELLFEQSRRRLMEQPPPLAVMNVDMLWRTLLGAQRLISQARLEGLGQKDLQAFLKHCGDDATSAWRRDILNITLCLWRFYEEAKRERNAVDFDDLIEKALLVLQGEEGKDVRRRYRAFLVDEYQDTDRRQQKLLEALCGEELSSVFVVGDVRQAIYAWRGAYPEGMLALCERGNLFHLTHNFRSRNEILTLANAVINADESLPESRLHNSNPPLSSAEPLVVRLFETPDAEAEWVAQRIADLIDEGQNADSVAVLARSRTHLWRLESQLEMLGVPFVAIVKNIYEAAEVLDVGHILVLGEDKEDREARVWLALRFGDVVDAEDGRIPSPNEEILHLAEETKEKDPFSAVSLVAERLGYLSDYKVCANIDRLLEQAARWLRLFPGVRAAEFGRYILAMRRVGATEPVTDPYKTYNAVRILTIHAAKGLEFDCVFLFDTRKTPSRQDEPFLLDADAAGVAIRLLPGQGEGRKNVSTDYERVWEASRQRRDREERRLLHVAVTRARKQLVITGRVKNFAAMMRKALEECGISATVE